MKERTPSSRGNVCASRSEELQRVSSLAAPAFQFKFPPKEEQATPEAVAMDMQRGLIHCGEGEAQWMQRGMPYKRLRQNWDGGMSLIGLCTRVQS